MRLIKRDLKELSVAAADLFIEIARTSIAERGSFSVALAGGSTPRELYSLLSTQYRNELAWNDVRFFFGDERDVPPDSTESNFRMANETLLKPLAIGTSHVFQWQTGTLTCDDAAIAYENILRQHFPAPIPRFDLVLLGLGKDGHTASIFPHTTAIHEKHKLAVSNWVPKLEQYRLTLTFPVLNNAANVMFLVSGEEKADAVQAVLDGEVRPDDLPAQAVKPVNGNLYWLLDAAASQHLAGRENPGR